MKHGCGMQVDAVRIIAESGYDIGSVRHEIAVTEHSSLGFARCATGVEDAGKLSIAAPFIGDRVSCEQSVIGEHTARQPAVAEVDDLAEVPHPPLQRLKNRRKPVIDKEELGARVLENVFDFRGRQTDVDRYDRSARHRDAKEILEVAIAVER